MDEFFGVAGQGKHGRALGLRIVRRHGVHQVVKGRSEVVQAVADYAGQRLIGRDYVLDELPNLLTVKWVYVGNGGVRIASPEIENGVLNA